MKLQNCVFLMITCVIASLQALDSIPSKPDFKLPEAPSKEVSDLFVFDFSCYGGLVEGLSKELVFAKTDEGRAFRLSQLDWEIRNLWVAGGRATVHFQDEKFYLLLDGWGKAASREAVLIDRDWNAEVSFKTPVHISWSGSHLKSAYKINGEFGFNFYRKNFGLAQLQTTLLIGYQYFQLAWKGSGGFYIYNYGTDVGFLPNATHISCSQEYSIPYFGLGLNGKWKEFVQWTLYGKVSNSAFVHQEDIRHYRGVNYDDEIPDGVYWMVGTSLSVSFTKYLQCNVKYGYEQMNQAVGITTVYREDESSMTFFGGGVYHRHQTLSLGISSNF